jgi:hypothetical protein
LEETATSETPEASPPEEQQQRDQPPEGTDWRAENTQLRQQLKHAQDLNRQAAPLVQTALALQATPGGNVIVDKLQKIMAGDKTVTLTATQEKKLEKAQEEAETTGMSEERVKQILDEASQGFEQRLWESRKAEKAMDALHEWAGKEYPGYGDLHVTTEWNENLALVLDAIQKGTLTVPEGKDPYKFALGHNYGWLKSLNPDIGKEKPSKKTEQDRRAAISQSSVQAGGVVPEESDDIPDYAKVSRAPLGVAGGGRAFGSLRRTK